MKFIYADSLDYVDPRYNFVTDTSPEDRQPYWDDEYPHEHLDRPPYDGILVSRAIVGDVSSASGGGHRPSGKYTQSQSMRFRLVGAAKFLRYEQSRFPGRLLFGDCGAFSYHMLEEPPYNAEDMLAWYDDAGFTHGCSVDHVIFDFKPIMDGLDGGTPEAWRRFELTLDYAKQFFKAAQPLANRFIPMGVIQGWSPGSMAEAARQLVAMGYRYLAVGGMVPLRVQQIHQCLQAIRNAIPAETGLHLLGFAKADHIREFARYRITSFDSTSPMLRAFKDAKTNYYLPTADGDLEYYTAVRVPQALENTRILRHVKIGRYRQEDLLKAEARALERLRSYDQGGATLDETLEAVMEYAKPLSWDFNQPLATNERRLSDLRASYRRTLAAKPWKRCDCAICRRISIEVIIFRSSNRNKRRGMHNLAVYYEHVQRVLNENDRNGGIADLFGCTRAAG